MNPELQHVVEQELGQLGFDVAAIRQRGSRARPVLEVRIARRDGSGVTVGDCATVSRALETRLDADGSLGEFYTLEVSSPGVPADAAFDWKKR